MRVLISKHFYSESSKEVDDADEEEMLVEKENNPIDWPAYPRVSMVAGASGQ